MNGSLFNPVEKILPIRAPMGSDRTAIAALCGFAVGVACTYWAGRARTSGANRNHYSVAGCKGRLWGAIGSALTAAQIYAGDRLGLYARLPNSETTAVTSIELAKACGLNERWIREWLAQQSAAGFVAALPTNGPESALKFYLPTPHRAVLADETSDDCTPVPCRRSP